MALLQTIRVAIATKADTDVASLRRAEAARTRRTIGGLPQVSVDPPTFTMDQRPGGATERYTLTYPGFLAVSASAGEKRADEDGTDLLYELIVSWRSGIQLGLGSSGVVGSWLSGASPSYDDSDLFDGYDLTWTVEMLETLSTPRSV